MKRILSYVFLLITVVVIGSSVNLHAGFGTIVSTAGEHGTIDPLGSVDYIEGADATYAFLPDPCYRVDQVKINGNVENVTTSYYTFTNIKAGETNYIEVTFVKKNYNLSCAISGNGTVNPNTVQTRECGSDFEYTFTPNPGHLVAAVYVDGTEILPTPTASYKFVNIQANHVLSVAFDPIPTVDSFTVTATCNPSSGERGDVSPKGTTKYEVGTTPSYTITIAPAYGGGNPSEVDTVLVDGAMIALDGTAGVTAAGGTYTFAPITTNHTIYVHFKPGVGIADETMPEIGIYPNPTSGKAEIIAGDNHIIKVEICNVLGKVVMTIDAPDSIDMTSLENGLYFVRLYTNNGNTVRQLMKK